MALNNTKVAVYWKDKRGVQYTKTYTSLQEAERARKWLIEQGASPADIEMAVVKEIVNEPEPIAQ